jgi:hypothetical protein
MCVGSLALENQETMSCKRCLPPRREGLFSAAHELNGARLFGLFCATIRHDVHDAVYAIAHEQAGAFRLRGK